MIEREITNAEQKRETAAAAVRLIEIGDQIVFDASTYSMLCGKGVHLEKGLSDFNESQELLKNHMMEIADETILMVDSTKFGTRSYSQIAPVSTID